MTTSMNGGEDAVLFLVSAGDDDIVHTNDDHRLRYLIGLCVSGIFTGMVYI